MCSHGRLPSRIFLHGWVQCLAAHVHTPVSDGRHPVCASACGLGHDRGLHQQFILRLAVPDWRGAVPCGDRVRELRSGHTADAHLSVIPSHDLGILGHG